MTRPEYMRSSAGAKGIFGGKDPGEACVNCRFFDESRGTVPAVCRRHKIWTHTAACCGEYEEKREARRA